MKPPRWSLALPLRKIWSFRWRGLRLAAVLAGLASPAAAQVIATPPQSRAVAVGAATTLTVVAGNPAAAAYQWRFNGVDLAGATGPALTLANVQPATAGVYAVTVTTGSATGTAAAVVGVLAADKLTGAAAEVGSNITLASNGNTYDQILLQGAAAAIKADPGQITRLSYLDLTDDIVQVEFSGAGTLALTLDFPSGPAAPVKYNQPTVAYMRGQARIVVAGADATTNVAVFSVGTLTAVNQALFPAGVTYDGVVDLASLAVLSADGQFGGVRTANASYSATAGPVGVLAPGVAFSGPVFVGDIVAFGTATPALTLGAATDTRITGGDLLQANAAPVAVAGLSQLVFANGTTSHGVLLPSQANQGVLLQNGVDVTSQLVVAGAPLVTIAASQGAVDETGANPGAFTLTRSGGTAAPLTVLYGVGGTATNGIDYPALVGFATFPAGASSVALPLAPFPDTTPEGTETVVVTLVPSAGYVLGGAVAATLGIGDSPGTLFVATLRPVSAAATASGTATLVLSASGTVATVNVAFSNLSSDQIGNHLFLGDSTAEGDFVLNLPLGQVGNEPWILTATGTHSVDAIRTALQNGQIFVGLDTGNFPAGELRGAFLSALASQTFTAPAAAPPVALTGLTATDAARLLTQATFGPRQAEIDALTGGSFDAWFDAQVALPASNHRARTLEEMAFAPAANNPTAPTPAHRQAAWFFHALQGPDQLRQRVAFALSQILVVSDVSLGGQAFAEGLANYHDLLAAGAFGNFRALLEQVTLSPIMGNYLSSLRNAKADPVLGTSPDENFAREVMQLFSIGLLRLHPDGTLQLDAQGFPIPTYDQAVISEMAKVFTGWSYFSTLPNPDFRRGAANQLAPMMLFPAFHENGAKAIVNGVVIPANQGGTQDLKLALDALFDHLNTGPFLARQLIQRLVTDNPSPAYVYRVAQVFADNGAGVRGDLRAVVRAVLADFEARAPGAAALPGYGKLKEPLLRFTGVLRSFGATVASGHFTGFANMQTSLAQAALRSPTVFNFFEPGYVLPGPLAAGGLVAPEFEITTDTTAISVPNQFRATIFATNPNGAVLNLAAEQALVNDVPALLDRLDRLLCGGQMTAATRARVTSALAALGSTTTALERAQTAVLLVATSPDGATQR